MLMGDLTPFDLISYQRESRDLSALAMGDYGPVGVALRRLFPNTALEIRAIPFVSRYVQELSGRYARPVVRKFSSTTEQSGREWWQKLQAVYTDSDVDGFLDQLERALVIQRSLLVLPLPDGIGRVRLHIAEPWAVTVGCIDPLRADDPRYWSKLTVEVPQTAVAGQVINGTIEITPTSAWRSLNGQMVGLYAEDGSNPFGRIPAVVVRLGDAFPGRWHGPINQSVLNLQIALSTQLSHNEHIVRHAAWPQKVLTSTITENAITEITLGVDKVWLLNNNAPEGSGPSLSILQGNVPVTELSTFMDNAIRLYCSMLGLDPSPFLHVNTAVTASARLFSSQDRQELKDRIKPTLLKAENQLAKLIAEMLSYSDLLPLPYKTLAVQVVYTDPYISADPLHDAQADRERVALGLESPADLIARERGISVSAAQAIYDENRKRLDQEKADSLRIEGGAIP